jgi:hypothetical protein
MGCLCFGVWQLLFVDFPLNAWCFCIDLHSQLEKWIERETRQQGKSSKTKRNKPNQNKTSCRRSGDAFKAAPVRKWHHNPRADEKLRAINLRDKPRCFCSAGPKLISRSIQSIYVAQKDQNKCSQIKTNAPKKAIDIQ